jgi:hypothetical protein
MRDTDGDDGGGDDDDDVRNAGKQEQEKKKKIKVKLGGLTFTDVTCVRTSRLCILFLQGKGDWPS